MITTIYTVCALRTNIVFFSALFTLIFAFGCATGAFWNLALGNAALGGKLTIVSGWSTPSSRYPYISPASMGSSEAQLRFIAAEDHELTQSIHT
jgi:hypothetical protein